jgi:hypothetical protein
LVTALCTQPPPLLLITTTTTAAAAATPTFIYCRGQKWWSYTYTPPYVFVA